jgi:ribosomal protein L21
MRYVVVEIAGRQYKVEPGKELLVNFLGDIKDFESDKVLMVADDKSVKIGAPYLSEKIKFDVLEAVRGKKIRVAIFHAKANFRKVKGSRSTMSKIKMADGKIEKKETK